MLELGKKYPIVNSKGIAAVVQRAHAGTFWVKIMGLTYNGIMMEYSADGTCVDKRVDSHPVIQLPQEQELALEEEELSL